MRMRLLLGLAVLASPVNAEPIDNCASLLGSISVELRFARTLPTSTPTTFVCPRDSTALVGASKQRILNSLGPPDATVNTGDSTAEASWTYFFSSAPAGQRGSGIPELSFDFDGQQRVESVRCGLSR